MMWQWKIVDNVYVQFCHLLVYVPQNKVKKELKWRKIKQATTTPEKENATMDDTKKDVTMKYNLLKSSVLSTSTQNDKK